MLEVDQGRRRPGVRYCLDVLPRHQCRQTHAAEADTSLAMKRRAHLLISSQRWRFVRIVLQRQLKLLRVVWTDDEAAEDGLQDRLLQLSRIVFGQHLEAS